MKVGTVFTDGSVYVPFTEPNSEVVSIVDL